MLTKGGSVGNRLLTSSKKNWRAKSAGLHLQIHYMFGFFLIFRVASPYSKQYGCTDEGFDFKPNRKY